jgi:hypothetical protein
LKAPAREKRADRIDYKKLAHGERRHLKTEEVELKAEQSEPRTNELQKKKNRKNNQLNPLN